MVPNRKMLLMNTINRRFGLFLLASALLFSVHAQDKPLTIEDAVLRQFTTYAPTDVKQLNWVPGSESFSYVKTIDEEVLLLGGDADDKKRKIFARLDELNEALKAIGAKERKRFPPHRWTSGSTLRFRIGTEFFLYDIQTKKAARVNSYDKDAENIDLNLQHGVAYTKGQNLYVSLPDADDVAVTEEKNQNIRHGEAAHRFEFGINKGTFWSPKGDLLAFYRMDESMVTDYPVFNLRKMPTTHEIYKYPFAGAPSHHVTLGVYNTKSKKTVYMKTGGDPEHYLTNITWSPDGKHIYIAELNRDQNAMKLNRYDAATGDLVNTVFKESNPQYVEPKHGPVFLPDSNDEFLWLSQRDGYNHFYRYKTDGTLLGQVTKGNWIVTNFLQFGPKAKYMYFIRTANNGVERHLASVKLKTGEVTVLTKGHGSHSVKVHPDGKFFIDSYSSSEVPRIVRICNMKGEEVQNLHTAEHPMPDHKLGQLKLFTIKAADDKTDLWCRMITPPDFDESKRYPAIVYVYNGPGVQLIRDTWRGAAPLWMYYAAQEGFVVFTVDGRGSANRGAEFEQAIFRKLSEVEIADQMKGVEYLKQQPWIDGNRMTVHGWSYGGYMTCHLMLRQPGTFVAGVAGGPVIDWRMYEVMYTERYMDTPKTNSKGYKDASVLSYVDQLQGKLMLIHGTNDDVVVWQHSLEFLEKAVDENVQVDYFVYPNHHHNVRGKDRVHLITKMMNYLKDAVE